MVNQSLPLVDPRGAALYFKMLADQLVPSNEDKEEKFKKALQLHSFLAVETAEGNNSWYEKVLQVTDVQAYLDAISHAWALADEAAADRFNTSQRSFYMGLQYRYLLMTVSISGLSGSIPTDLLCALVGEGLWSPDRGFSLIVQNPNDVDRVQALIALLATLPEHPQPVQAEQQTPSAFVPGGTKYWPEIWESIARIRDKDHLASAIAQVAGCVPRSQLSEWLEQFKVSLPALNTSNSPLRIALAALAPYLSEELLQRSLTFIEGELRFNPEQYELALADIAPQLIRVGKTSKAIQLLDEIRRPEILAQAVAAMIPYLPAQQHEVLISKALNASASMDASYQIGKLVPLLKYLPDSNLEELVIAARSTSNPEVRAELLLQLLPSLQGQSRQEAFEQFCRAIEHMPSIIPTERRSANKLIEAIPILSDDELQYTLNILRHMEDEEEITRVLVAMASRIPPVYHRELIQLVSSDYFVAQIIAALAPTLQPGLLTELVDALAGPLERTTVTRSTPAWERLMHWWTYTPKVRRVIPLGVVRVLILILAAFEQVRKQFSLLSFLLSQLQISRHRSKRRAPDTIRPLMHESSVAAVISAIAPYVPDSLLQKLVPIAQKIENAPDRAHALGSLMIRFSGSQQETVYKQTLAAVEAIQNKNRQVSVATALANRATGALRASLLRQALRSAQLIDDEYAWVRAISEITPLLPAGLANDVPEKILMAARTVLDGKAWEQAVVSLLGMLVAQDRCDYVVDVLKHINREDHSFILAQLATKLAEQGCLNQAVIITQEIMATKWKARALANLLPHVEEPVRSQLFEQAQQLVDQLSAGGDKTDLLNELLRHGDESKREMLTDQLLATLRSAHSNPSKWNSFATHFPELFQAAVEEELAQIAGISSYNQEKGTRLAAIIPFVPKALLPQVMPMVIGLRSRKDEVLSTVALSLSDEASVEWAMQLAHSVESPVDRLLLLTTVASNSSDTPSQNIMSEIEKSAAEVARRTARMNAIALAKAGAVLNSPELLDKAAAMAEDLWDNEERVLALVEVAAQMPPDSRTRLLQIAIASLIDIREAAARERAKSASAQLLTQLFQLPETVLYDIWTSLLHSLSSSSRRTVLENTDILLPILHHLGKETAVVEAFCAVQDVGRWWPSLPSRFWDQSRKAMREVLQQRRYDAWRQHA